MMKAIYILPFFLFLSCGKQISSKSDKKDPKADTLNADKSNEEVLIDNVRLRYQQSFPFKNGCTIIPVILDEITYEKGETDRSYSNIIFVDKTNQIRTIDSLSYWQIEAIHIYQFYENKEYAYYSEGYAVEELQEPSIFEDYLLLRLVNTPNSVDNKTLKKAENVHLSSLAIVKNDGTNFKILTPEKSVLKEFTINPFSNTIVTSFIIDKNNDGLYDDKDGMDISCTRISSGSYITSALLDSITEVKLLNEYMQKIEKQN